MRIGNRHKQQTAGERERWVRWRAERLASAGVPHEAAQWLARQEEVDLHALLELIDRGCPPHLAARILAPLDDAPQRR